MQSRKIIALWLALVLLTIFFQLILGGYVRLTQSGLSMYDWHVVHGVIPPLTEEDWQEAFENYKQTPEYIKINVGMSLHEYKLIYLREYNHRILGRLSGLIFVVPLFLFIFLRWLPWRENKILLAAGLLYAAQGLMGWYMVQSGLVDNPHVSPYRLAAHFWLALIIFIMIMWRMLSLQCGGGRITPALFKTSYGKNWLMFTALLIVQISWGAFMAGLKAGHVSNSWPLMFGYWIPPNMFSGFDGFWSHFVANSVTVHFIHRWLAFLVLAAAIALFRAMRRLPAPEIPIKRGTTVLLLLTATQLTLGILVILFDVRLSLALIHQGLGAWIFFMTIFLLHRMAATQVGAGHASPLELKEK